MGLRPIRHLTDITVSPRGKIGRADDPDEFSNVHIYSITGLPFWATGKRAGDWPWRMDLGSFA